jgi:hypothetical protein
MDEAIPSDRNVMQKDAEKKLSYKSLKYKQSANVKYERLHDTSNH